MSVPSSTRASMRTGVLCLVAGVAAFSSFDALNKALSQSLPVAQRLWVYYLAFTVVAAALTWRRGRGLAWRSRRPVLQAVRSLVLVVETGLFAASLRWIQLADMQAIAAAAPLMVLAASAPALGEPVGKRGWLAVAIGFAGVLLVVRPGLRELNPGILMVLAGAVLWAAYQILLRIAGRHDEPATTALWTAAVGALALSVIGPFDWVAPDGMGWLMLAGIAAAGAMGHVLYSIAFRLTPAADLQPFSYLALIVAAGWGWAAFGQLPDAWTIGGAALIVGGGLVALRDA